jgi:hypothetical protein
MKRKSSRSAYYVQRIPADIKGRVVGQRLAIPFGDSVTFVTPTARAQSITFSLGTDDPAQVKILQAAIAGHLEGVWQALRNDEPVRLTYAPSHAASARMAK